MQAKAARNVVRTVSKVLDVFEKRDKTGTVAFILKWFGLGLRYLLTLFPLLHMNIFYLLWLVVKHCGGPYDESSPTQVQTAFRSISYVWIPIFTVILFVVGTSTGIFNPFTDHVLSYCIWFTWALCIPLFWFVDLIYDKVEFNKSALRYIGVPNVKFTIDFVVESQEMTFLWVSSLIALSPATIAGYFASYIYAEFIDIGSSRPLTCLKIDFESDNADNFVEVWNLCLEEYDEDDLLTSDDDTSSSFVGNFTTTEEYVDGTRVCCKLGTITTETFLDAFIYLTLIVFFSRLFVRFVSDFVLRSEQVRNPKGFVTALKTQIARVKENVDETVFKDRKKGDDDDSEDEEESDVTDAFEINKTGDNVDMLLHDINKIERKGKRKKAKAAAQAGQAGNGQQNDNGTAVEMTNADGRTQNANGSA